MLWHKAQTELLRVFPEPCGDRLGFGQRFHRRANRRAQATAAAQTESVRARKNLQRRPADHVRLKVERIGDRGVSSVEAPRRGLRAA